MPYRREQRLQSLTRQHTSCGIGHRDRQHNGQTPTLTRKHLLGGSQGGLDIQRIEGGLYKQQIHTAIDERLDLIGVCLKQHIEIYRSKSRIIHIGRHRGGLTRRANRARHKAWTLGRKCRHTISLSACHSGGGKVYTAYKVLGMILGLRYDLGVECAGGDNIGASLQICTVDGREHITSGKCQHFVIACKGYGVRRKLLATEILLTKAITLNHRTHSAIEEHDTM